MKRAVGRPEIPDPVDLFVRTAETLVEQYERYSKLDEDQAPGLQEFKRVRRAVKRKHAAEYMLLVLVSLGVSLALIRAFLALTGYPQIGGQELHIAHVLWGGLVLFVAALLPLVISNRWASVMAAILAGLGMGLFIDEVGKFITQSNDYFYRPAAPIIYAFFLLTLWLYRRVSRPPTRDPRAEMYRVIDGLGEILDHDLDERERSDIQEQLMYISSHAGHPDLVRLSSALQEVISSENLHVLPQAKSFWQRLVDGVRRLEASRLPPRAFRSLLGIGMLVLGAASLRTVVQISAALLDLGGLTGRVEALIARYSVVGASATGWISTRLSLEGVLGLVLLIAAVLLVSGREQPAVRLGRLGLVINLVVLDVVLFYLDQFAAIGLVIAQLTIIGGLAYYEQRHLKPA